MSKEISADELVWIEAMKNMLLTYPDDGTLAIQTANRMVKAFRKTFPATDSAPGHVALMNNPNAEITWAKDGAEDVSGRLPE